jgi:hypothetical protein
MVSGKGRGHKWYFGANFLTNCGNLILQGAGKFLIERKWYKLHKLSQV